jgi:hypothetical protein
VKETCADAAEAAATANPPKIGATTGVAHETLSNFPAPCATARLHRKETEAAQGGRMVASNGRLQSLPLLSLPDLWSSLTANVIDGGSDTELLKTQTNPRP